MSFQPTPDPPALGTQQLVPLGSPSRDQQDFQLKNKRQICGYPKYLTLHVGGKRVKPLSIEALCDWVERAQPTPRQLQR